MCKTKRGRYFKYLRDNKIKIPRTTLLYRSKLRANDITRHQSPVDNLQKKNIFEERKNNNVISEDDYDGFINEQSSESEDDDNLITHAFQYGNFQNEKNSTEELCAAAMAFYYSGNMTQIHFSSAMRFFNLGGNLELPTSFDQVAKYLSGDNNCNIGYNKIFFCKLCNTEKKILNRYDRLCNTCDSR